VKVTAIHGEAATLQIERTLKSAPGATLPVSVEVRGIAVDSAERICRDNAALVGHRHIVLLWRSTPPDSGWRLIGNGVNAPLDGTPDEQEWLRKAVAIPLPASKWRAGPGHRNVPSNQFRLD